MSLLIRPEGPSPEDAALSRRALAKAAIAGVSAGVAFAGYAPAALAQSAQPIVTDAEGLTVEEVAFAAQDGFQLPAYVARPAGDGPHPVVIVASEIFGVHAWIQDICRRLAKAGYAAVAPAFFVRVADPAPLSDMAEVQRIVAQAGYEQVMGDVAATLAFVDQQLWADAERVGITGYCWGGKVVWQAMARFAALDAGVAWYGRLGPAAEASPEQIEAGRPWPVDLAGELKGPVLGLYGGQDRGIPLSSVEAMNAALERANGDSAIRVYPEAEHGFHADYRASYDAQAGADGWARLLAHFEAHLRA